MGGVTAAAAQPTEQLAVMPTGGLGGLKAGVAPNTSNITPMPTMTHDLVQPAGAPTPMPIKGDIRTGGPGIGPPSDLTQPAPILSPAIGMEPRNMPMQQPMRAPIQQPMFNPQMQRLQGLQQLYSMFSSPQMRMPMQMPMYRSPALNYRPNIQQVQQNLSRVKPSVYKTDLDAAQKRIAELEAQLQPRGGE